MEQSGIMVRTSGGSPSNPTHGLEGTAAGRNASLVLIKMARQIVSPRVFYAVWIWSVSLLRRLKMLEERKQQLVK